MSETFAARAVGAIYKSQLLNYYYSRRAESTIDKGERFEIKSAIWGKSNLVTANKDGGWDIANIPPNFTLGDLTSQFGTSLLVRSVQGTVITLNAILPQEQLKKDEVYDFNTLVLLDGENKAVAVLATQQDTVYNGKNYSIVMTIEQSGS